MARDKIANNTIDFVQAAAKEGLRIDGRRPNDMRALDFKLGPKDGLVEVTLGGKTRALAEVTAELTAPPAERPNEGVFSLSAELPAIADTAYEGGRAHAQAVELSRALEKGLRESGAVDKEALCVLSGRRVWFLKCDVRVLDNCGGVFGAAGLAAIMALKSFRRPEVTVYPDTQNVVVHSPEEREPVPLSMHHMPFPVQFALVPEWRERGADETKPPLHALLDPGLQEEESATSEMVVTVNAFQEVCLVHKSGGDSMPDDRLMACIDSALAKAGPVTSRLKEELSKRERERVSERVRRRDQGVEVEGREVGVEGGDGNAGDEPGYQSDMEVGMSDDEEHGKDAAAPTHAVAERRHHHHYRARKAKGASKEQEEAADERRGGAREGGGEASLSGGGSANDVEPRVESLQDALRSKQ